MELSNGNLLRVIFLESVESGNGLPDGCDARAFARAGLIRRKGAGWILTYAGRRQLAVLRMAAALPIFSAPVSKSPAAAMHARAA